MTSQSTEEKEGHLFQLQLLLEELCTELCRFEHVVEHGIKPEHVRIDREHFIGPSAGYTDIRVTPRGRAPYVVEVKFGYSADELRQHLKRKYAKLGASLAGVTRMILVIDSEGRPNWSRLQAEISASLDSRLKLEVWNEGRLVQLLRERFRLKIPAITPANLLDVRQEIDRTKGFYAFGGKSLAEYEHTPLNSELLWHFGFWKLQQLRRRKRFGPREILPPGLYPGVAVLVADLCSYSSYVRDTPDSRIVRDCLTSFYSKARYQIINNGGMIYQFVGDQVIGLFGIPDRSAGFAQAALDTARSLLDIGNSVSQQWQRQLDRAQPTRGLHIGLATGDLQIVSLRPFSRAHVGAVADCVNVAARLMSSAGPSEIVISNSFHQSLALGTQRRFQEMADVEAKNMGRIKAWKLPSPHPL